MQVESKREENKVYFKNFVVLKKTNKFYGIYRLWWDGSIDKELITSGSTLESACKKAKLLQIGFNMANDR